MSSNNNVNGQVNQQAGKTQQKSTLVNNPYAKKRSQAPSQQQQQQQQHVGSTNSNSQQVLFRNNNNNTNTLTTNHSSTIPSIGNRHIRTIQKDNSDDPFSTINIQQQISTFSQAFESVEETNHYRNEINEWSTNSTTAQSNKSSSSLTAQVNESLELRAKQREFEATLLLQQQQQTKPMTSSEDQIIHNALNPPKLRTGVSEEDGVVLDSNATASLTANSVTATASGSNNMFQTARDHHVLYQQPHVLYVSTKQKGNGVLNYIRNVPITYTTMEPDYILSTTRCALFLSMKYHNLFPNYIHKRIAGLKTDFTLRLLLVLVDIDDCSNILVVLNKLAVVHNFTLLLSWSEEEIARYLETYKVVDGKDCKLIQRKEQLFFGDQVSEFLSTRQTGINKTDSGVLIQQFHTIQNLSKATVDELAIIPGLGEIKVKRLYDAFHKPFSKRHYNERKKQQKILQQQEHEQRNSSNKEDVTTNDNVENKK